MTKVTYGKSMYGGWYGDFFFDGKWTGVHASTKTMLKEKLNDKLGTNWIFAERMDN